MTSNVYPRGAVSGVLLSQWGYWCMLATAVWVHAYVPQGSIRTILILTPVLPALIIFANTFWIYEACDEYVRSRILKCIAITAIIVTCCTFGYFALELFGWPRLSMLWINLLGWSIFNLQMLYVILRSR